jgi:putative heme iron utilization protein
MNKSEPSAGPFTPDVVAQIMHHMNVDHAGDSVLICRALGGQPEAESAEMSGMDDAGIDFRAHVSGRDVDVRIPWSQRLTERAQVRVEVVRMYQESCAALGIEPRAAG